jgi:RNA polymerase sigma factor (sigma-70 family)
MIDARIREAAPWGAGFARRALRWVFRSLASAGGARDAAPSGSNLDQPARRGARRIDPDLIVTEAYEAFQADVYSFALHSTRDADAAADVTQETFFRLIGEVRSNGPPANLRAWLFRVASNLVLTGHRRRSVFDRYRGLLARPEVSHDTPERVAIEGERTQRIEAALARVSSDAKVGLLLAAQGFAGREIADAIGRTELATRTLLCRARIQLRDELGSFEEAR